MTLVNWKSATAAVAMAFAVPSAHAATITGLFNTGTDAFNVALVGGAGTIDPHYVILSSTSPGFAGQQAVTFNCCYLADDADSRWVSLSNSGNPGSNVTTYRTTFDLTGLDPLTAVITGRGGSDNAGTILINGVATGQNIDGFGALVAFSINTGFVSGVNTLDFVISDFGPPTAFRVDDLVGTAELAGVIPEPSTWALLMLGFGAVGGAMRRRNVATTVRYA